jgi:hypothetical protein
MSIMSFCPLSGMFSSKLNPKERLSLMVNLERN